MNEDQGRIAIRRERFYLRLPSAEQRIGQQGHLGDVTPHVGIDGEVGGRRLPTQVASRADQPAPDGGERLLDTRNGGRVLGSKLLILRLGWLGWRH